MRDAGHLAEEIQSPSPSVVADLFLSSGECIGIFLGYGRAGAEHPTPHTSWLICAEANKNVVHAT